MIYGSVCSGIEAASVAWAPLGWSAAFVSEIDKFPCAVLAHRFPDVPLHGDFTTIEDNEYEPIDLLVGGTPCQSFSIAGLRGGLDDDRGNLALEYLRLAQRLRPKWLVWENVPGVLSSGGGRDFGSILGGLVELGYGFAYRVLDAQYVRVDGFARAVPQRRRRVFVVGYLGDWRRAAAVLFERESLSGHPAPRRKARERIARSPPVGANQCSGRPGDITHDVSPALVSSGRGVERTGETRGQDPVIAVQAVAPTLAESSGHARPGDNLQSVGYLIPAVANPLTARMHKGINTTMDEGQTMVAHAIQAGALRENPASGPDGVGVQSDLAYTLEARSEVQAVTHALRAEGFDASEDGTRRGTPLVPMAYRTSGNCGAWATGETTDALTTATDPNHHVLAFSSKDYGNDAAEQVSPTLRAMPHDGSHANGGGQMAVATPCAVRRLTPTECERLQGFPDGWTAIPWRNKDADACPDGPRYKALGNSMAVNVMRWIGQRIDAVEKL